jgi:hypothetical protein
MRGHAYDLRDDLAGLSHVAEPQPRKTDRAATNIVDINERLPLHLDMVVADVLAEAVEASRKAGASDHRIFRRMAEFAASVLDDPMRPELSPEGPLEALHAFQLLAPAFFELGLPPAQMAQILRYFAAAMAGEIEAKGLLEEAKARVVANRTAAGS